MRRKKKIKYDPTPEQIIEGTRRIRENWDDRTHLIRLGFSIEEIDDGIGWMPPLMSYQEFIEALEDRHIQISG